MKTTLRTTGKSLPIGDTFKSQKSVVLDKAPQTCENVNNKKTLKMDNMPNAKF